MVNMALLVFYGAREGFKTVVGFAFVALVLAVVSMPLVRIGTASRDDHF